MIKFWGILGLGGVFLGFRGNWLWEGFLGVIFSVATRNLLLKRLSVLGFSGGGGILGGFCV